MYVISNNGIYNTDCIAAFTIVLGKEICDPNAEWCVIVAHNSKRSSKNADLYVKYYANSDEAFKDLEKITQAHQNGEKTVDLRL